MNNLNSDGKLMYKWAEDLFPICRSITGQGVRETLRYLKEIVPELEIHKIRSGTKIFDWIVPDEWVINEAWISDSSGNKVINFKDNNLHIVGYSIPVDTYLSLEKLQKHLYSLPEQPNAIPYVTSYYNRSWGFCISDNQRLKLKDDNYHIFIDSKLHSGELNYGEIIINSHNKNSNEVFLSTYICHPSMANNELSGPVVTVALARWIKNLKNRKYSYRIIFIPETIGSIAYLSKNYKILKKKVKAGFNITCVGDNREYSYLPSRSQVTLSDEVAIHALKWKHPNFIKYNWNDRGSDERQYCAPGIDLPVASIFRSKYGAYAEYHTSEDMLGNVVTEEGLQGSFDIYKTVLEIIEKNCIIKATNLCEPQLGKRGLYPNVSQKNNISDDVEFMMNLLTWADGKNTILNIADKSDCPVWFLYDAVDLLLKHGLIKICL